MTNRLEHAQKIGGVYAEVCSTVKSRHLDFTYLE